MEKLHAFHKTRRGYITFGIIELAVAYVLASISIDTANMFAYVFTVVFLIGSISNFINAAKPPGKKAKSKLSEKKAHAR